MKSKFEDDAIQQTVVETLERSTETLDNGIKHDIAMARQRALHQALKREAKRKQGLWLLKKQYAFPSVFAVALLALVLYQKEEPIPALPKDVATAQLPLEDIYLLEDLEFATWLATQEIPSEEAVL